MLKNCLVGAESCLGRSARSVALRHESGWVVGGFLSPSLSITRGVWHSTAAAIGQSGRRGARLPSPARVVLLFLPPSTFSFSRQMAGMQEYIRVSSWCVQCCHHRSCRWERARVIQSSREAESEGKAFFFPSSSILQSVMVRTGLFFQRNAWTEK